MILLKKLQSFALLSFICTFLLAGSLTSCNTQAGKAEADSTEQPAGEAEHPKEEAEHPEKKAEHPEGEAEHPKSESDTTKAEAQ